jgi:hypothetical protein
MRWRKNAKFNTPFCIAIKNTCARSLLMYDRILPDMILDLERILREQSYVTMTKP